LCWLATLYVFPAYLGTVSAGFELAFARLLNGCLVEGTAAEIQHHRYGRGENLLAPHRATIGRTALVLGSLYWFFELPVTLLLLIVHCVPVIGDWIRQFFRNLSQTRHRVSGLSKLKVRLKKENRRLKKVYENAAKIVANRMNRFSRTDRSAGILLHHLSDEELRETLHQLRVQRSGFLSPLWAIAKRTMYQLCEWALVSRLFNYDAAAFRSLCWLDHPACPNNLNDFPELREGLLTQFAQVVHTDSGSVPGTSVRRAFRSFLATYHPDARAANVTLFEQLNMIQEWLLSQSDASWIALMRDAGTHLV